MIENKNDFNEFFQKFENNKSDVFETFINIEKNADI